MVGKCLRLASGFRLATAAVAIIAALALGAGPTRPANADDEPPQDLTFEGEIEHRVELPVAVLGGAVSLTLTPDRSGIVRAAVNHFTFRGLPPGGGVVEYSLSGELYYDPPRSITDGQFEVGIPISLVGMIRDRFELQGTFVSDTEASGTVADIWASSSFAMEGPVDTPPGPDDAVHIATVEENAGSLVLTTDADGNLTSFALKGVSFEPCLEPDRVVNVHAFFEPPVPLDEGASILVSLPEWLHGLTVDGAISDAGTLAGTLRVAGYYTDCRAELRWTTEEFEPTATATPVATSPPRTHTPPATPAVSQLPDTGLGAPAQPAKLSVWTVVIGLLALALGLGGSATWRKRFD